MILASVLAWAVVTLSSSFMRAEPDYEAPLDNQLLMGELVETLETNRYWVKVQARDYCGWVTDMGLCVLDDKDSYLAAPKWICVTDYARIRKAPSERSEPLSDFTMGDLVRQTGVSEGGWVQVLLPDGRTGWVLKHEVMDFRSWAGSRDASGQAITSLACSFAGTPYLWGGNSVKHFDCSGLVQFCYFMHGVLLPRNASQQIKCGTPVEEGCWEPGDLLFFGSRKPLRVTHVAMYIGGGRIVHSSHMVRINSLSEYGREVVGATRVLGSIDSGSGAVSILRSPYYFPQDGEQE